MTEMIRGEPVHSHDPSNMFLGIEIGGTKLQLGVGRGDSAELVALVRRDVDPAQGGAGIRAQIAAAGRTLIEQFPITRIGIGFGGPVFGSRGLVQTSHQITGWDGFPLSAWCEETLGRPTRLGNDCDCAALAEACFGAGRDQRSLFYVTVGTGIGGGFVVQRQVHGTDRPAAAEIGHLQCDLLGGPDVEGRAAGPAIAHAVRKQLLSLATLGASATPPDADDLWKRCGGKLDDLTTQQIGEAARSGNQLARQAYQQAATTLGWAVAQMITLLAPDIVVIGGGVSLAGEDVFFAPLRAAADRFTFAQLRGSCEIVPAQLGETVVVQGAVALAAT